MCNDATVHGEEKERASDVVLANGCEAKRKRRGGRGCIVALSLSLRCTRWAKRLGDIPRFADSQILRFPDSHIRIFCCIR